MEKYPKSRLRPAPPTSEPEKKKGSALKTLRAGIVAAGALFASHAETGEVPRGTAPTPTTNAEAATQNLSAPLSLAELTHEASRKFVESALPHADASSALNILSDAQNILSPEELSAVQLSPRAMSSIALLAHDLSPNYAGLDADPALAHVEKVNLSLVLPLVRHRNLEPTFWDDLLKDLMAADNFIKVEAAGDYKPAPVATASIKLSLLKALSEKYSGVDPVEFLQSEAYVARNLYMKGVEPTDSAVMAEVAAIQKERQVLENDSLLKNDVLVVSHGQTVPVDGQVLQKGSPRFGTEALINELKAGQKRAGAVGKSLTHITPFVGNNGDYDVSKESATRAKHKALTMIANSVHPLTVFLDGHGSGYEFFLSEGEVKNGVVQKDSESVSISADEMAKALEDRWQLEVMQHPDAKELNVSFVFSACYMQNFARSLADLLNMRNVPLPHIMISDSDFGQKSFTRYDNQFGSDFNKLIAKSPNMGTVIRGKESIRDESPTIYVPHPNDPTILMQVSGIGVTYQSSAVA